MVKPMTTSPRPKANPKRDGGMTTSPRPKANPNNGGMTSSPRPKANPRNKTQKDYPGDGPSKSRYV